MKPLLTTLFILSAILSSAQDIDSRIEHQLSLIRSGSEAQYDALEQAVARTPVAVQKALSPYLTDTLATVREWIYLQYHDMLTVHEKPMSMRQDIVLHLTGGISDPEPSVRNACLEYLTQCRRQDFTPQAVELFVSQFNGTSWFSKDLLLMAGFLGDASCRSVLEDIAWSVQPEHRRLQWHACLALSRMGDNNAMNWCLSQISRTGINDGVVYELLPGLVYTRQPRMFEFLISVLNSDDNLCTSSNPDSGASILCGYRVMEYLAPVIRGYPLKQLPSGDMDTRDYHKSLLTVRGWFAGKAGEYEIIADSF